MNNSEDIENSSENKDENQTLQNSSSKNQEKDAKEESLNPDKKMESFLSMVDQFMQNSKVMECQICKDEINFESNLMWPKCSMTWWKSCILNSIDQKQTWPNCRVTLTKGSLIKNWLVSNMVESSKQKKFEFQSLFWYHHPNQTLGVLCFPCDKIWCSLWIAESHFGHVLVPYDWKKENSRKNIIKSIRNVKKEISSNKKIREKMKQIVKDMETKIPKMIEFKEEVMKYIESFEKSTFEALDFAKWELSKFDNEISQKQELLKNYEKQLELVNLQCKPNTITPNFENEILSLNKFSYSKFKKELLNQWDSMLGKYNSCSIEWEPVSKDITVNCLKSNKSFHIRIWKDLNMEFEWDSEKYLNVYLTSINKLRDTTTKFDCTLQYISEYRNSDGNMVKNVKLHIEGKNKNFEFHPNKNQCRMLIEKMNQARTRKILREFVSFCFKFSPTFIMKESREANNINNKFGFDELNNIMKYVEWQLPMMFNTIHKHF